MADKRQHSALTDADGLHEPVGVSGAASGKIYIADGVGSGVWSAPELHYGQMDIIANASLQTVGVATTEQLIGDNATGKWVTNLVNGITFSAANQAMSVDSNGIYLFDFWCSFTAPINSVTTFYFSIDGGVTLSTQIMARTSTAAADIGVLSAKSIVSLTTLNVIEIHVENSVGGSLYFQNAGMSLVEVKET